MEYIVEVPRDIEARVVQHFLAYGLDAQTELPETIEAGMVRVTRTGGDIDPDSPTQDVPQVLIETWGADSAQSWGTAVSAWAILSLAVDQHEIDGVELYDGDLDVPRTLDDDLAPSLHRHQFLARLTIPLTEITITMEGPTP